MWQALGRSRNVQRAFDDLGASAHHVERHAGDQPTCSLWVAYQPGLRPGHLGHPEEPDRASRVGQRSLGNGGSDRASGLEQRSASRGVVVGARCLVTEVCRQDDLSRVRVGPRNRGVDDVKR
jgi:hypothetical protein